MTFFLDLNDGKVHNYFDLVNFLSRNQDQHIIINTNYEGACLDSLGVYSLLDCFRFKSVTVVTGNQVEYHPTYQIRCHDSGFRFFYVPASADYSKYHGWNRKYIFGAFYNRATWNRMGLAGHLAHYHRDTSMINFRADPHNDNDRKLFEMETLFNIDMNSAKNFLSVADQFPRQYEEQDGYTTGVSTATHSDQLAQFYTNFLIDIVAETFVQGRSFFPTEKTTRPMLLKKPFIIMGPKCNLIHLRQMGFQTFDMFWDEEYDGYGVRDKYLKILKLIDNLSIKSSDELAEMYAKMQPILDHNYNLLIEKKFSKNINYVE